MSQMKDLYGILTEWYPDGNYNEQQLWEAIANLKVWTMQKLQMEIQQNGYKTI